MRQQAETLAVRITRKAAETPDICVFDLESADATRQLPPFSAGAHVEVEVPGGLLRQYSLCNPPRETGRYRIAVLRERSSRGGSAAMHEHAREGDLLRISTPRNHFALLPATHTLLIAGGIGITPILAMAEQLAHSGREFSLHYCAKSQDRAAFLAHLEASAFSDRVELHFDDGDPSQRLSLPRELDRRTEDARLYMCGPGGFMQAIRTSALATGWPPGQIHSEAFGATTTASGNANAFEVVLRRSGGTLRIPPEQSVAQVLAAAGRDIPVSCEAGVCGTCLTPVLEGVPDHRDSFLMPEERARNDCFTPCCSRALSPRLVLDL